MYSLYCISFFLASVHFSTFDCAPGRGFSLSGIPMNVLMEKSDPHFPADFISFADSAECKDDRDCSWIPNALAEQLAERPEQDRTLEQAIDDYCQLHKTKAPVKQCRKTCKLCKAPAPIECKDQRDCSWIPNKLAKQTEGAQTLEEYCKFHKDEPSIKQCSKTCKFCKLPSPPQPEQPIPETDKPITAEPNPPSGGMPSGKAPSPTVCEDERPDCIILIEITGGGEALTKYCDTWKKEKSIQQCRKTCNLCKPPSPPIEETMAPQKEQPTPEIAEPTTAEPATTKPITAAPKTNPPSGGRPSGFQRVCLEAHNKFRDFHNAPPLQWSPELTRDAQEWANHLASLDQFDHDPNLQAKGQGENLYYQSPPERLCNYGESGPECLSCEHVVGAWYDEKNDYDYTTGETKTPHAPILHFTQIVWRATRALGMATAVGHNKLIVVARYSPAGNIIGKFQENVLPDFP